ncbi:mitochondrial transcription termination factorfamily protein [Striga asiatica]|uniref:Mitochondrial transcription termination factorfamily protein n=1 Tax=Striga asiatica TaxID=4170 RepID=A0A5A7PJQ2_STRAF|nr:mitochondrial transcription termination factorfamily protein [Striga asiatica]
MAVLSLTTATLPAQSRASSLVKLATDPLFGRRRVTTGKARLASSYSNPTILKSNRQSRSSQPPSLYDTDDDEDGTDAEVDDDWCSEDDFGDIKISEADRQRLKLKSVAIKGRGNIRHTGKGWDLESSKPAHKLEKGLEKSPVKDIIHSSKKIARDYSNSNSLKSSNVTARVNSQEKDEGSSFSSKFCNLSEELDLRERHFLLLDYLSTFGLKESHFIQMYDRHMKTLDSNVKSAEERLNYLLSVGVKHKDIRKIILRQPQILGYSVENNLKSHVSFLRSLGIPESRVGNIITATPSLFNYSIEKSLKPTVRYLLDEIGIPEKELSKVVQLSPQILVQRIDNTWTSRLNFLIKELDSPRRNIVKMVTKHPQILHYSVEAGLLPRINFLRSIGLRNSDILKILTRLSQVFSLSLEGNLKPKYMYLINELRNEAHSLTKYPMYLSLSLDQRIRPRHRFLVSLKKAPKGPFPLGSLFPTDECFCQKWAGTSLDKYLDFRQKLHFKDFAKKYGRK